ncbi:hypothetical protein KIP88_34550 [Bradyrhizobium sp. SRL28]|uniref:hypothetical protein n=1 Tax=Bradyrhizobium sp. SRL28 TaxID=2836178 RepID=UPI001BDEA355|nr:hypothetical protein [Bradyrhizobium sp. SRL28]MBT1515602.1 hypothetical protein [Bradyrhizobium sp. SRL28]
MVEPGRREAASAGNSMMVPMFRSFWLPPGTIWPATSHYSEQNVVNGILICAGGTVTGLWGCLCAPKAGILSDFFTGCFP